MRWYTGASRRYIHALHEACDDVDLLSDPEEHPARPAITLPGHMGRVLGFGPTTEERELQRLNRKSIEHGATRAYHFDHARIQHGDLLSRTRRRRQILLEAIDNGRHDVEMRHAVVAGTPLGAKYFGHWLVDDLPQFLLAQTLGPPIQLFDPASHYTLSDYATLAGIQCDAVSSGRFERLTVLEDFHQNSFRMQRAREIRRRLVEATKVVADRPPTGIYLKRGTTGVLRQLTNEEQLADHLAAQGFVIIDHTRMTAAEIFRTAHEAPLVVCVEGSHEAHALYAMADAAAWVSI
ncbi:MAG: glycosyltransferase family 61 protein, partial [Pirellulales bacterium]|nr:glycosyltransferase family 61 protein [Pirellulales bacterium]